MSRRLPLLSTAGHGIRRVYNGLAVDFGAINRALFWHSGTPPRLDALPKFIALEDKKAGESVLNGDFLYAGQSLSLGPFEAAPSLNAAEPWTTAVPSEHFAARMHSFAWLYDLATLGESKAGPVARHLTDRWINVYGKWNPFSWQDDILAERQLAMLMCWSRVLGGDKDRDAPAHAARRAIIARQASRLRKTYRRTQKGMERLRAAAAITLSGAALDKRVYIDRGLDWLDDAVEVQILGDGGHISRCPANAARVLRVLLAVESALKVKGVEGSRQTRRAIDRLTPALSFFTSSDGALAAFNGSGEYPARAVKALIKQAGVQSKAFSYMPHSGYQRLEQNGTVLIMDTGDSPPRPYDNEAHLSPLAFELSAGSGRIIVNCGWAQDQPPKWRPAVRETAAHSTLILDECSSGAVLSSGPAFRVFGPAISQPSGAVNTSRKEQDSGIWLEASHDGYLADSGLKHRRKIYMDPLGQDIRGEDSLYVPMGSSPKYSGARFPYAIRFHIHPDVRVTLARDLKSALLIMPNKDGWRFRTDNGPLGLQRSVYLARGSTPQRNEQLVINAEALSDNDGEDRSNRIRWSFKRLGEVGQS